MRILCGTDFSEASTAATQVAADVARRFGDSLVLVHSVTPLWAVAPMAGSIDVASADATVRRAATQQLAAEAQRLRAAGLEVEERLLEGAADLTLVEEAHKTHARFIVLGTHGRRAPARWFLGSTAERVLDAADRPVLVVPAAAGAFGPWARRERPLHLWVGLDRSVASEAAIDGVRTLREAGPCDVTYLHVYWPPEEYTRFGLEGPRNLLAGDPELNDLLERDLNARIPQLPGEGKVSLRLRPSWGNLGESIAACFGDDVDLVVVGTHQRTGWSRVVHGSVARATLRAARQPVLCVPLAARAARKEPLPKLAHVLVTTDFSPVGNAAIPYAYSLARGGGQVELCHVYERELPNPVYAYARDDVKLAREHRVVLEERLRGLIPAGAAGAGVDTRVVVIDGGKPADGILHAAERLGVDAICIASHGRTGTHRVRLGSVAEEVLRHGHTPVFVVRRPAE